MVKKKRPPVSYGKGRIPSFKSSEALAKYLDKKAKEQKEAKEKKEQKR